MSDQGADVKSEDWEELRRLDAAREGDLVAFNWLVLRYQTRVYNLCLRMLSDPDAAADATQDTFLSAYRAMDRFRGEHFRTWLLRIASNACLDVLRSRKRRPTQSLDHWTPGDDGEEIEPIPVIDLDPTINPEVQTLRAETVAAIQAGLDTLADDQRIALLLVDVQGLSYEEAVEITGANLGTVKSRINRARAKMRDHLRERGILPSVREHSGGAQRSITTQE